MSYSAPARASFWQKLGPGGSVSLLVALAGGVVLLGLPVFWRLRGVLATAAGEAPEAADAILVLGRRLEGDRPSPVFEARLAQAEALWRKGHAPRIIVAGGITGRATRSEAEVGAEWLRARGVAPEAILTEDHSQHTLENLFNVRRQLDASGRRRLLLVSDPLHLARAAALARGLNLEFRCMPATASPPARGSLAWWYRALFEAFLLHWYYTGMAYSRLTGARSQLERVT